MTMPAEIEASVSRNLRMGEQLNRVRLALEDLDDHCPTVQDRFQYPKRRENIGVQAELVQPG